jgi:hypothetical protein
MRGKGCIILSALSWCKNKPNCVFECVDPKLLSGRLNPREWALVGENRAGRSNNAGPVAQALEVSSRLELAVKFAKRNNSEG